MISSHAFIGVKNYSELKRQLILAVYGMICEHIIYEILNGMIKFKRGRISKNIVSTILSAHNALLVCYSEVNTTYRIRYQVVKLVVMLLVENA